jgi:hypothetical protein
MNVTNPKEPTCVPKGAISMIVVAAAAAAVSPEMYVVEPSRTEKRR